MFKCYKLISKVAEQGDKVLSNGEIIVYSYKNNPKTLARYINARQRYSFHRKQKPSKYRLIELIQRTHSIVLMLMY